MNEFSIICRVLGSLFYRQPQDSLLVPLFTLIQEGKLAASWPLEQDALLTRLQKSCDPQGLAADYNALFVGESCRVSPYRSVWMPDASENAIREFLVQHDVPLSPTPADHFGSLLLAASWLEDRVQTDETEALVALFDDGILPWSDMFLGKVEAHATTPFYRTLAIISREALSAMRDELDESVG